MRHPYFLSSLAISLALVTAAACTTTRDRARSHATAGTTAAELDEQQRSQERARSHRYRQRDVSGEIKMMQMVQEPGQKVPVQLVTITTSQGGGQSLLVDLGPSEQLGDLELSLGSKIAIRGYLLPQPEELMLIAEKIKANDQQLEVRRFYWPGMDQQPAW